MIETKKKQAAEKSKPTPLAEDEKEQVLDVGEKFKAYVANESDPLTRDLGQRKVTDADRDLQALAKASQPLPEFDASDESRVTELLTKPKHTGHKLLPTFTKEPWAQQYHFEWFPLNKERINVKLHEDVQEDGRTMWAVVTRTTLPSIPEDAVDQLNGTVHEDWLGGDPHVLIMCREDFYIAKNGKAYSLDERAMGKHDVMSHAAKLSHKRITEMEETGTASGLPTFDEN